MRRWINVKVLWGVIGLAIMLVCVSHPAWAQAVGLPTVDIKVGQSTNPQDISKGLQILILLTVLTLAPALLIMTTAFTRIVIVMSLTRQAVGLPQLPPNQVLIGLSLILTFFVMAPTFAEMNTQAFQPYLANKMPQQTAMVKAIEPLRTFMFKQVNEKDVALFVRLAKIKKPQTTADVPTYVLLPAFVISEMKIAFQLGFVVFLPFLIVDIVISSILVSMGMMFLPPVTISLPFKVILFVLVDGWHLVAEALVLGFH